MMLSMLDSLQRLNPWWTGKPSPRWREDRHCIDREVFPTLLQATLHREDPLPVFVRGPRQVGKTTLVHQLLRHALEEEGWPASNLIYADMEDAALQGPGVRGVVEAVAAGLEKDAPVLFVLDEVHYAEDWAQQLKVLADEGEARFLITGSASAALLEGMREKLPGRLLEVPLLAFSFDEFCRCREVWRRGPFLDAKQQTSAEDVRLEMEEYLAKGGFPRWVNARSPRTSSLASAFVMVVGSARCSST